MITRRNWLLKCSILVNVAVLLYICSHVMVGNNTNNFGMSSGSGSASYLIQQLSPTSQQQSTQQQHQKESLSPAQMLQDEQELAAILRNKENELQKQIKMQETAVQVSFYFQNYHIIKHSTHLREIAVVVNFLTHSHKKNEVACKT